MKNNSKRKSFAKKEEESFTHFEEFYIKKFYPNVKDKGVLRPDLKSRIKQPDYHIHFKDKGKENNILIEIKTVVDRKELEASKAWSYNVKRLKNQIFETDLVMISGTYIVETPQEFKVTKGEERKIVIIPLFDKISSGYDKINIDGIGTLKIRKVSDEKNAVYFSMLGSAKWVDSPQVIFKNIGNKINTANEQLKNGSENLQNTKNILLLINQYDSDEIPNDFLEALTFMFEFSSKYEYIHEVWLQNKFQDGSVTHNLLLSNKFRAAFENENIEVKNEEHISLFEQWFYPLSKAGDKYKSNLFTCLKTILKDTIPITKFGKDPHQYNVREEMVRLGLWLYGKKRYEDTIWIIEKFLDDPDPPEPENYSGDPDFNYHQQIENGEDPLIVTTVLGHLALVIQKIALQEKYVDKSLEYTKKLLQHKNNYVKLQAIIPLIEIAARRMLLSGWAERPRTKRYKEFHELVFDLVKLVKTNQNYTPIAKWLSNVFAYYKDLSTEEAEKVLNALKISDESAPLFIYYAIYRKNHYEKYDVEFNSEIFDKKLQDIIKGSKDGNINLRSQIVWQFWKILDENKQDFNLIKPYIKIVLEQPYEMQIYDDIERIIKDFITTKQKICTDWYLKLLKNIEIHVQNTDDVHDIGGVWLTGTEEIVPEIAKHDTDKYIAVVASLARLYIKKVDVLSIKLIIESYKFLPSKFEKEMAKKELRKLYREIKAKFPKTEKIDWNL